MSAKMDSPPPYEDAVHQPKYEDYPNRQQQDSTLPPPPSYSPSSNTYPGPPGPPGYWSQQGVHPQSGVWAAPGFSPSVMPMTIPTLCGGGASPTSGCDETTLEFS